MANLNSPSATFQVSAMEALLKQGTPENGRTLSEIQKFRFDYAAARLRDMGIRPVSLQLT